MVAARTWFLTLLLATAGSPAHGQVAAHDWCRDSHPWPVCHSYLLVEITGTGRPLGTKTLQPGCPTGSTSRTCLRRDLQSYLVADVGFMRSRDSSRSTGASLQLGGSDDGARAALRFRSRAWLGERAVLDLGAGPLAVQQRDMSVGGSHWVYGGTAHAGIGLARMGVATLGLDLARNAGHSMYGMHVGAALESRGILIDGAALIIGALALASAISQSR